jgi:hypothetical protein
VDSFPQKFVILALSQQLGVFRFSLLKNRDVAVGVLLKSEEVMERLFGFRPIAGKRAAARHAQIRERIELPPVGILRTPGAEPRPPGCAASSAPPRPKTSRVRAIIRDSGYTCSINRPRAPSSPVLQARNRCVISADGSSIASPFSLGTKNIPKRWQLLSSVCACTGGGRTSFQNDLLQT